MVFDLNSEQKIFSETLRTVLSEKFPSERLIKIASDSSTYNEAEILKEIALLGLPEFLATEEFQADIASWMQLIAFEAGRALFPYPLYETLLGAMFNNEHAEFGSVIFGYKNQSPIRACTSNLTRAVLVDNQGALVKAQVKSKVSEKTLDLLIPHAKIEFHNIQTQTPRVSSTDWLSLWRLVRASELAGIAQVVVERSVDYVKQRKQFGVPVGSFQAVQHALANAHLEVEALISCVQFASWTFSSAPNQTGLSSISALRQGVEQVIKVVEVAIQMHGGMGFTWDSPLHLYLRRAQVIIAQARELCAAAQMMQSLAAA